MWAHADAPTHCGPRLRRWEHGVCKVINVYSSLDLLSWRFRGIALHSQQYADRPKVVYSAATGQYVLWVKSTPNVGVAVASTPVGPFREVGHFTRRAAANRATSPLLSTQRAAAAGSCTAESHSTASGACCDCAAWLRG